MNTSNFIEFCKKAKKVVGKNSVPILGCVLIKDGTIRVTNLEIDLIEKIECLEGHELCMDFKDFSTLVEKLKNQDFEVSVSVSTEIDSSYKELRTIFKIEIITAKGIFKFTGSDPDYFPKLPGEFDGTVSDTIRANEIPLLRKACKYVSSDELRPIMKDVFLSDCIVASDAKRLCFYAREGNKISFLMPPKVVSILDDVEYSVLVDTKNIKLVSGNTEIIYSQTEGEYPAYRSVIPTSFNSFFDIPAKQLSEILDFCELTLGKNGFALKVSNDTMLEELTISCQDLDCGKSYSNTIPVKNQGDPITIGMNLKFLKDFVSIEKPHVLKFKIVDHEHGFIVNDDVLMTHVYLKQ